MKDRKEILLTEKTNHELK